MVAVVKEPLRSSAGWNAAGTDVIVLLHGAGQTAESWTPVVDQLDPPLRTRAVTVDLGSTSSLHEYAETLERRLADAGAERALLCGVSFGALVAMQYAIEQRQALHGLLLCAPVDRAPRLLVAAQRIIMTATPAKQYGSADFKRQVLGLIDIGSRADFRTSAGGIRVPTFVTCGSDDRHSRPAAERLARVIPDATLEYIEGAGHAANTDQPAAFASLVARAAQTTH